MIYCPPGAPTGNLPRKLCDSILWTGGCLSVHYLGERVFGHFSTFVIKGSKKTLLVDTGHVIHRQEIEKAVEDLLEGQPLDYIFPTHAELPHGGLLPHWLNKYPQAVAVGDMRDWDLYYPEFANRFVGKVAGDSIDLGDRDFVFVPAVWRDLPNTLWGFDTGDRVLFVSDAFAYLYYHHPGQSDFVTGEMPPPDARKIRFVHERTLQWIRFTDIRTTFDDLDRLLTLLRPQMIAPAHGPVINNTTEMTPVVKDSILNTSR